MPGDAIRVLLVDDHALMRAGVRRLLEEDGSCVVVGEAADARGAIREARRSPADVVVLDVNLRDRSGLTAIDELRDTGAHVVMLSMHDEPAYARRALELGASGYVVKDAADRELVEAVRAVAAGEVYIHPKLAVGLVMGQEEDELTRREREILREIALGYSNREIAEHLFVSVRTIEAHRRNILGKLRLETRADLVRYALDHGLLTASG
jgi:two-component system, NarL family, response regulator NreC